MEYLRAVLDGTGPGAGEGAAKPAVSPAPTPETLAVIARQHAAATRQQAAKDDRFAARDARARRRRVEAVAQEPNPTQRDSDHRLFLNRSSTDLDRDDFRRHGWASALNASAIFAFWEELVPGLFDEPA